MKYTVALIALMASVFGLHAQYMPTEKGTVLTYAGAHNNDGNTSNETITVTVTDVTTAADGVVTASINERNSDAPMEENYTYTYNPADGLTVNVLMTPEEYRNSVVLAIKTIFEQSGQYISEMDLNELRNAIRPSGTLEIPLPASVEADAPFEKSSIRATVSGQTMGMKILKGKYLGYEELETEAGKFDCLKLSYLLSLTGENFNGYVTSWFAKGIGLVKQEVKDKKGNLLSEQTLKAVAKQ